MTGKEFIEKFLPLDCDMYRLAFSLTGSGQDAEDIVQELFMKLWKSLDSLDSVKSPRAYCLTLTRNLCIDLLRRRKRVHAESIEGQADIGSGPDAETGFILEGEDCSIGRTNRETARKTTQDSDNEGDGRSVQQGDIRKDRIERPHRESHPEPCEKEHKRMGRKIR